MFFGSTILSFLFSFFICSFFHLFIYLFKGDACFFFLSFYSTRKQVREVYYFEILYM